MDQQQEGQQGIASQMPPEMMEEQVSMSERVPARFGGDMEEKLSMRETIDTPTGIETIKETDTMKMAGGGERGWKAQMLAQQLVDEKYPGKDLDFYDLPHDEQYEIYTIALDMIDSGGQ
jgi:hypothetical protein